MFVIVILVMVAIFVVPAFWAQTALGESIVWSVLALLFPLSLVSLVVMNLQGTLATRLSDVKRQIGKFKASLNAKLAKQEEKGAALRDGEHVAIWRANLKNLEEQEGELERTYQLERFRGSFAFLAAVYAFGFFLAFNNVKPVTDLGGLQTTLERMPNAAIAALFGAWAFALYSVIARISTADQSPQFLLRLSYQPVIAIGVATFATFMFADEFVLFIAFAVGFLPYSEIVRWIRVQAQTRMNRSDQTEAVQFGVAELTELDGIDFDEIERLHEENIKNIQQLAYANPLEVHFSTAYPLKIVIDWTDQALLRLYLGKDQVANLKPLGIRGAIEMAQVRRRVREMDERIAGAAGDQAAVDELTKARNDLLAAIAAATGTDRSAVRYLAYQLGEDPHVRFIYFLYDELADSA
ncbi:hypothetical protein [Pelagibius sp.]|uniref:hypothetical protein n=1 Tax=Pelagibius sp. TaxID=1931238 RepID=UPI003B51273B